MGLGWFRDRRPYPFPPSQPFEHYTGTIRETCSCGATIEAPATTDGRDAIADWRHMHRHVGGAKPKEAAP